MNPQTVGGRYEIIEQLGKGGMGSVYRALDSHLNREVAVKILSTDSLKKPTHRRRFVQEAQLLTTLEHRAIVPLYDFGGINPDQTTEEDPYLVMRYMPGGSVADMLKDERPLPMEKALHIAERISAALDYAHDQKLIHRDIKPANFLLDNESAAYLADFGIAKSGDTTGDSITRHGVAIGTYAYMSPEQIKSSKHVDGRTDIYSFGVVLFELLTGRRPFGGDGIQMMYGHLEKEVPTIFEFNRDLPYQFDDIIRRALAKEPDHRYDSAKQLVRELKTASTESEINLDFIRQRGQETAATQTITEPDPQTEPEPTPITDSTTQTATGNPLLKYGGIAGLVLIVILGLFAFLNNQNRQNLSLSQTSVALAAIADNVTPTETPLPTAEPVAPNTIRVDGSSNSAIWRINDGAIANIPEDKILPIVPGEQLSLQVNAEPLRLDLPNGDRLFIDRLTEISLEIDEDDEQQIMLYSTRGSFILESSGDTTFIIESMVTGGVENGRLGILRTNENSPIEFHCLVGDCIIKPASESSVPLSIGSYTAVDVNGRANFQGSANYTVFDNILNSVIGALPTPTATATRTPIPTATPTETPTATATSEIPPGEPIFSTLGESVEGLAITMVQFGDGENAVVMIGGMHSGYAPNSVVIAETAVEHFTDNPQQIPENVTLYIIINLNPDNDGIPGRLSGRLNANGVDINRNWDCRWQEDAVILGQTVEGGGGERLHSEPETRALKALIDEVDPVAVVVWGAGNREFGAVAPGACSTSASSIALSQYYGFAADYDFSEGDSVPGIANLTGDFTNEMDERGIPAIFIIVPSYTEFEWEQELAGIRSVLVGAATPENIHVTPTPTFCEDYELANWSEDVLNIILRPIGCATTDVESPQGALQQFASGWMLWREDTNSVYVMYYDGNFLDVFPMDGIDVSAYEESDQLQGAFGYLHTTNNEIAAQIGLPIASEQGLNDFIVQDFENGMILSFSNLNGRLATINLQRGRWRWSN